MPTVISEERPVSDNQQQPNIIQNHASSGGYEFSPEVNVCDDNADLSIIDNTPP